MADSKKEKPDDWIADAQDAKKYRVDQIILARKGIESNLAIAEATNRLAKAFENFSDAFLVAFRNRG